MSDERIEAVEKILAPGRRDRDAVTTQKKKEILFFVAGTAFGWFAYDWSLRKV